MGGCNGENSPNFCFGYFIGFSKIFGHPINNTEIWNTGNNTGSVLVGNRPIVMNEIIR
ncbi:MAG: hypothetical protein WAK17_23790 [Candidatus Nitrosopolaris sp.]|jgi:hypothetical protein